MLRLAIVVSVIVLIGTTLTTFIEVMTSVAFSFKVGVTLLITNALESDTTKPIVAAKA